MSPDERERLARLEEKVRSMEKTLDVMSNDLRAIRTTLSEAKGGWRTLLLVIGAAGAAGAVLMKIGGLLLRLP